MAAELVRVNPAAIFVGGSNLAVHAALAATRTIPIIFTTGVDPVAAKLVGSLNRPEANATGVTMVNSELGPKKLALLHEAVPAAVKIGMLINPENAATSQDDISGGELGAQRLGLEIIPLNAATEADINRAFASAVGAGAGAMFVGSDAFFISRRNQISSLGLRQTAPASLSRARKPAT